MEEVGASLPRRKMRLATAAAVTAATLLLCVYAWQHGCPDGPSLLSTAMLGVMFALPFSTLVWNSLCLWTGARDACVLWEDEDGKKSLRLTMWMAVAMALSMVLAAASGSAGCPVSPWW
jgi:hypothetical protein